MEKGNNIAIYLMNSLAEIKHYSWGDDFCLSEIKGKYEKSIEFLKEDLDFYSMTDEELESYGFGKFSATSDLRLIPIYAFDLFEDGSEFTGLFGGNVVKGKDKIDMDIRRGCLAYGINPKDIEGNESTDLPTDSSR